MERTVAIHEVFRGANDTDVEVYEKARCPFCKEDIKGDPLKPGACKHLIRVEHGCGGNVAIFAREKK